MDFSQQSAGQEITELIHKREKARAAGNWPEADFMRQQLTELGVDILDTPQGQSGDSNDSIYGCFKKISNSWLLVSRRSFRSEKRYSELL